MSVGGGWAGAGRRERKSGRVRRSSSALRAIESGGMPSRAVDETAAASARTRAWSASGVMSTGVCTPDGAGRAAAAGPKPVAITVILTFPLIAGSTTAPKMMLASSPAAS
jgi:hypothetical protein